MTHTVDYQYDANELRVAFTGPVTATEAAIIALAEAKRHAVPALFEIDGVTPPDNLPLIAHPFDSVDDVTARFERGRGVTDIQALPRNSFTDPATGKTHRFFQHVIDNTVVLELSDVFAGMHVNSVAAIMVALARGYPARANLVPVRYEFNGTYLIVERGGKQTPEETVARWSEAMNLSGEAYRRTPEAIALRQKMDEENRRDEGIIAGLFVQLPAILDAIPDLPGLIDKVRDPQTKYFGGPARIVRERLTAARALLAWFQGYAAKADNNRIDTKLPEIIAMFEARGFKDGDGLGRDKDAYKDPILLSVNMIGQSIGAHKSQGLPPHPVVSHWAEKAIDVVDALLRNECVSGLVFYEEYLHAART